jgi:hypothetical protein
MLQVRELNQLHARLEEGFVAQSRKLESASSRLQKAEQRIRSLQDGAASEWQSTDVR